MLSIAEGLNSILDGTELRFIDEALELWVEEVNAWEITREMCDRAKAVALGKLRGYLVRIAGLLHLLNLAAEQFSDPFESPHMIEWGIAGPGMSTMQRVLKLCEFCSG